MMLARTAKGIYVDKTDFYVLAARTSSLDAPLVVEELKDFGAQAGETDVRLFAGVKGGKLIRARVAVYPPGRFLQRVSLDARRIKDEKYLPELVSTQLRLDPAAMRYNLLYCGDGTRYEVDRVFQKDGLLCGARASELADAQKYALQQGLFPDRLEIGSVALVGGLVNYLAFRKITSATLLVELLPEQTHLYILANANLELTRTLAGGFNTILPVVQKELGLKDEESAGKLFFSNNFDFTTMGPQLIRKLARDLQSAIGFFEVQTGQNVGQIVMPQLPVNLRWLGRTFAEAVGVGLLDLDLPPWLESVGVKFARPEDATAFDARWLGLGSLMARFPKSGGGA